MCLRWRRFIRETYKRVGETTNEIFLCCCNRGTCGVKGIVAGNDACFVAPFAPERYLAAGYFAGTSGKQLGQNYKWPCDRARLQTPRDIDPRLIIGSRALWVTLCTVRG